MHGDASSVAWLITPAIDLDANNGVTINFKTSNSFADGSNMELLFSTDWDGTEANIASATWGILPAAYIVQNSDFFGDWLDSR
ncbi:choice-of-anchor J domain-containing protein [Lacinutrix neustonica]|uniref:Choice-of-anchor J domain-containing protein n=1 Tax=Lacinutrix neustonica TaxID=2980107 RepID=A0A9E8MY68_9FLAO|nr:choice-of-anchor J domain-containing protein [Lacinutrix neustonica]WAC03877.1 choice-of-anchor J domain-containing protein [Lacinutrix neustonica]